MTRASDPSPGSRSLATLSRKGRGKVEQGVEQPSPLVGEGAARSAAGEGSVQVDRKVVVRLVEDRLVARHFRNMGESDRIRDQLAKMGIALTDHEDGITSWEVKR
jgi:cysteinyl-tRNA synthetase